MICQCEAGSTAVELGSRNQHPKPHKQKHIATAEQSQGLGAVASYPQAKNLKSARMCSPDCYRSEVETGAVINGKAMALGVSPRPSTGDLGGGLLSSFEFGLTALIVSPSQEHETACVSDVNRASFRRSSRRRSLQLSTKPFYLGGSGAI